ncbi:MAG: hypothetical protein ABI651_13810 [Verrucomicrobiota bacterium]
MPHAYTEDQLVEQPAIGLFAEQSALPNPQPGLSATLLPLREGLWVEGAQLTLPPKAIASAVDVLTRDPAAATSALGAGEFKNELS